MSKNELELLIYKAIQNLNVCGVSWLIVVHCLKDKDPRDTYQHEVAGNDQDATRNASRDVVSFRKPLSFSKRAHSLRSYHHCPPQSECLDGSSSSHSLKHWYRSAGVLATSEEPVSQTDNFCTNSSFPIATSLCLLNSMA